MNVEINITANGKKYVLPSGATMADFMRTNGIVPDKTIAALNDEVVKRDEAAVCVLHDGDKLDLMTFAGGG